MSVGLLDVNVLIALAWPSHVHHRLAHAWFAANHSAGWATCPLTQCAFIRVSSNPKIIPEAVPPTVALALLREMVSLPHHVFWPEDIPFCDEAIPTDLLVSHRQVTDAYLLGLSIRNGGRLITFDHGLSALLPKKSPQRAALEILGVDN